LATVVMEMGWELVAPLSSVTVRTAVKLPTVV